MHEFERYATFILEVCDWRIAALDRKLHGKTAKHNWPLEERARLTFADPSNPNAPQNSDFLFHVVDTWAGIPVHLCSHLSS